MGSGIPGLGRGILILRESTLVSISGKAASLLVLAVVVLALSANVSAQYQYASQPQVVNGGGSPGVMIVPPTVNVIAGGIYGTGVYVTPPATLPVQNTGISLANQAGISLTAPLQTGVTIAAPGYGYGYGVPGYNGYNGVINAPVAATVPTETGTAETGRLINDPAPSYYAGSAPSYAGATAAAAEATAGAPSLAEIAAQYKAARPQNVRMYTNEDAGRMAASVKTGTSSNQPPAPQTNTSQMAQASPPPATQQPAESYSKGSPATTQSQTASQSANQPANPTTPQVNPPAQKSEQNKESLPATATILPFLGFLGLLSGGAGLWLIKFRK